MKELKVIIFVLLGVGLFAAAFNIMYIMWVAIVGFAITLFVDDIVEEKLEEKRLEGKQK